MGIGHRGLGIAIVNVCGFLVCTPLAVVMPQPASAAPPGAAATQPAAPAAQPTSSQDQGDNTGDDFIRPLKLLQFLYEYKTAPGSGSQKGTIREVTTDIMKLRSDYWIDLSGQWTLALRADLPLLAKDPITSDNPAGHFLYGVGDADFQAALLHEFDARWAIGFGARLTAPTGEDNIGSGKWQIMPAFGARYALPAIGINSYLEPIVWYAVSFAGDPTKKNISNLQFAPTFRLGLPDHWFVTFYPSADIRVNYGDPVTGQTGRLFLPFDFQVGRKLTKDLALSIEVGVPIIKDYPVYDFKTMIRLNMLF
jgi:hypothetical protein